MVYRVMHAGAVIGTSLLEGYDPPMGMAFGVFVPAPAFDIVSRRTVVERDMARRSSLEPHLTIDELEDVQADRCIHLQRQQNLVRSATLFPWWPRRIVKRKGPRKA